MVEHWPVTALSLSLSFFSNIVELVVEQHIMAALVFASITTESQPMSKWFCAVNNISRSLPDTEALLLKRTVFFCYLISVNQLIKYSYSLRKKNRTRVCFRSISYVYWKRFSSPQPTRQCVQ